MGKFKESEYYTSGKFLENSKKASILGSKKLKELRIIDYNKKPKYCSFCNKQLKYEKRKNKFCNSSCSALFNNNKKNKSFIECENCKNLFIPNKKGQRFCCHKCSIPENKIRVKEKWENNEYKEKVSNSIKKAWSENRDSFSTGEKHSKIVGNYTKGKYKKNIKSILDVSSRTTSKILKRLNIKCSICGWDKGTCDIHHINGKKIDNFNDHNNLTYICPNCHRLVHEGKINNNELKTLNDIIPENWVDLYYG